METCPSCSTDIPNDVGVCPKCGKSFPPRNGPQLVRRKVSGMAIASLYLSLGALLLIPAFAVYVSLYPRLFGSEAEPDREYLGTAVALLTVLAAVIAVVLGHKARKRIKRHQAALRGEGRALAGLFIGYPIAVIIGLLDLFLLPISPLGPIVDGSRVAGKQASAVHSLWTLKVAADEYRRAYRRGFPVDLGVLGEPEKGRAPDGSGANLVDPWLARGHKAGYVFLYRVTAHDEKHFPSGFTVSAIPVEGCGTGNGNCYFLDEAGVFRIETERPADSKSHPLDYQGGP